MTPVKVLEVTEPTLIRRQPIYTVQMTSGTRIGATYEVVMMIYKYLSKDKATELDRYGILKANSSILTASSKLDLAAIDDVSPLQPQQWNAMNGKKFRFGTFSLSTTGHLIPRNRVPITHHHLVQDTRSTWPNQASQPFKINQNSQTQQTRRKLR